VHWQSSASARQLLTYEAGRDGGYFDHTDCDAGKDLLEPEVRRASPSSLPLFVAAVASTIAPVFVPPLFFAPPLCRRCLHHRSRLRPVPSAARLTPPRACACTRACALSL